ANHYWHIYQTYYDSNYSRHIRKDYSTFKLARFHYYSSILSASFKYLIDLLYSRSITSSVPEKSIEKTSSLNPLASLFLILKLSKIVSILEYIAGPDDCLS